MGMNLGDLKKKTLCATEEGFIANLKTKETLKWPTHFHLSIPILGSQSETVPWRSTQ